MQAVERSLIDHQDRGHQPTFLEVHENDIPLHQSSPVQETGEQVHLQELHTGIVVAHVGSGNLFPPMASAETSWRGHDLSHRLETEHDYEVHGNRNRIVYLLATQDTDRLPVHTLYATLSVRVRRIDTTITDS
ncbi:hypothetical protein C0Q70_10725 [Pomacea canaliculata]|uniref:Uncharacterized protein n=2 Tax=Pomacea canaliculata TaxID=400727 RepID=A0A2T7P405_POMCA|nr:hypothetical protein C0Q70_10725 [Pomacea canaliculata]